MNEKVFQVGYWKLNEIRGSGECLKQKNTYRVLAVSHKFLNFWIKSIWWNYGKHRWKDDFSVQKLGLFFQNWSTLSSLNLVVVGYPVCFDDPEIYGGLLLLIWSPMPDMSKERGQSNVVKTWRLWQQVDNYPMHWRKISFTLTTLWI